MSVVDLDLGEIPQDAQRQEEFGALYSRYAASVSYFFARRGCSQEETRDLAQETFLRAYRGFSGFRGDSTAATWLLRVAANVWKNSIRDRRAVKRTALVESLEAAVERGEPVGAESAVRRDRLSGPLDEALERERGRKLRDAVSSLPPRMRRSVMLRIDRGLRYREIASMMQVSVDTVKTQLHQARQRLKVELGEYFSMAGDEGEEQESTALAPGGDDGP